MVLRALLGQSASLKYFLFDFGFVCHNFCLTQPERKTLNMKLLFASAFMALFAAAPGAAGSVSSWYLLPSACGCMIWFARRAYRPVAVVPIGLRHIGISAYRLSWHAFSCVAFSCVPLANSHPFPWTSTYHLLSHHSPYSRPSGALLTPMTLKISSPPPPPLTCTSKILPPPPKTRR